MPDSPFVPQDALPRTPDVESPNDRRCWQFSIRGMLIFTTSIAIGLSAMLVNKDCWFGDGRVCLVVSDDSIFKTGWIGGLLATLVVWVGIGLAYQVHDLWKIENMSFTLDAEQRRGRNFEIFWRLCILAVFVFYAVLAVLLDRRVFKLAAEDDFFFLDAAQAIREGIFVVMLLAIVGSIPSIQRETKWTPLLVIFYLVASAVAIVFCLQRWMDNTVNYFFVHLATVSIDSSQPEKFAVIDHHHYLANSRYFFAWSLISSLIVVANGFFLCRLANQWSRGMFRRWLWGGLLVAGLVAVGSCVFWIQTNGLKQISPFIAEVASLRFGRTWFSVFILLAMIVTAWTYRMAADWKVAGEVPAQAWRKNSEKYYHEGKVFLVLLIVALLGEYIFVSYQDYLQCQAAVQQVGLTGLFGNQAFSFTTLLRNLAANPALYFWLALLVLSITKLFSRRKNIQPPQAEIPRLNLVKFAVVWIAAAAFAVTGGAALAWMSFALWFSPWVTAR